MEKRKSKKYKYKSRVGWFLCGNGIILMFFWNWKLLLATSCGVGLMLLIYLMEVWNWKAYWHYCQRFFNQVPRRLLLAVCGGSLAAFTTYMAASIWFESENRWLATGTILQGFVSLLTFVLLLWHISNQKVKGNQARFETWLQDLTATDPLKRLIAVRQLSLADEQQVGKYFELMLSVEQEPIIREALLESLEKWDKYSLAKQPINIKPMVKSVYSEIELP